MVWYTTHVYDTGETTKEKENDARVCRVVFLFSISLRRVRHSFLVPRARQI